MTATMTPTTALIDRADGYLIDPITGEVMGNSEVPERFEVTDLASAAWVLRKRQKAELRVQQLQAALAGEIKQVEEDYRSCIAEAQQRAEWWAQYDTQLEALAKAETTQKSRSIKIGPFTIGFRKQAGRVSVRAGVITKAVGATDAPPPLIAWARNAAPGALKRVEEFQVSGLPSGMDLPDDLFETIAEFDKFYVKLA